MTRFVVLPILLVSSVAAAWPRGGGNRPRPEPVSMDRLRTLTAACESAMEGPDNEHRCLDTVAASRNPTIEASIAACESAMEGDESELGCIQLAASSRFDINGAIGACESAMEGDPNELACVRTVSGFGLSLAAVNACEVAMEGDDNELRCLGAVAGSRYDAGELVRYCDDSESGDDAELACIARWR